jgi:CheY-like chemotaxis protein
LAGSETILLVEDEDSVRKLALHILKTSGYKVLEAASARDALAIEGDYKGTIHLLITDMVMPRMGGRELSQRLLALRPQIKVIYMSGYTDNSVIHDLTLESGTCFIHKPFSPVVLLQNVRALLSN